MPCPGPGAGRAREGGVPEEQAEEEGAGDRSTEKAVLCFRAFKKTLGGPKRVAIH